MAHQVISANTLANPIRLVQFLEAATQSLTLDEGLDNLAKIADLGAQFKGIGLDKIQFITVPWQYAPEDPNRIRWLPEADQVWHALINDKPLAPRFLERRDQRAAAARLAHADADRVPDGNSFRHAVGDPERLAHDHPDPDRRPLRGGRPQRVVRMTTSGDDALGGGLDESAPEDDAARRRRLAEVFGDVLPDTTSDERDPESADRRVVDARRLVPRPGAAAPRLTGPQRRAVVLRLRAGRGSPRAGRRPRACPFPRPGRTAPWPWCRAPRRRSRRRPRAARTRSPR